MSFGIKCIHCGHQQSAHEIDESGELLPGKKKTLNECKETTGFSPEDRELQDALQARADNEELMREMRKRGLSS